MKRVGLTIWLLLLAVSTNLYDVEGRSTGPPAGDPLYFDSVCNQMIPNSFSHEFPTGGNGGYFIDISPSMPEVTNGFTYVGGQTYTIRVVGTGGSTIRGFLVQARVPDNAPPAAPMLLGSFQTGAGNQRTLDCDAVGASTAAIGHSTPQGDVSSVQFSWVAPSTGGTVDFHYTVVRTRFTHFDAMSAKAEGLYVAPTGPTDAPTTPVPTEAPTTSGPTTAATTAGPTQPPPDNTIPPLRSPEDYRLVFSSPDGCARADCDIYIGIDTNTGNDSYLDIYLEGTAAGWVAVGFSETNGMFSSDVVACNRVGGGMAALDTWNLPQFQRGSPTDTIQDVYLFYGSYVNGRISCKVAKRIAASDQFDLDLNRDLFVIYARRTTESSALMAIQTHSGAGARYFPGVEVNPATDMTGTAMPPTTQAPTTLAPGNPIVPQRSPEDYRLIFSNPEECNISDCDHFIGIDTNAGDSNYLDIYMEGDATGWVAVGFSKTSDMLSADVVACNRVDDTITALDNWNVNSGRDSATDALQDVTLFNSSFVDGRITCTVAKRIAPSDMFDLNLNRNLFVIYARRIATSLSGLTRLDSHSGGGNAVRSMSAEQVNPAQTGGTVGGSEFDRVTRPRLIRAHGTLMIIAWPMLAVMGIFFTVFMRPAMPDGGWFQAHRALLIISEIVATAGFILIFVALKDRGGVVDLSNSTSVAHLVIGVIVMALHITNPIIAIFRCKPDGEHRWIYNLLHGAIVGTFAEILALINIALGIYLFTGPLNLSRYGDTLTPFWLYISWDAFYVALIVVLFVVFTISAFISSDKDREQLAPSITRCLIPSSGKSSDSEDINYQGTELTSKVAPDSEKEEAPDTSNKCGRKRPSKDSCYRWVAFGVFSAVTNGVLTALIVLIARAQ